MSAARQLREELAELIRAHAPGVRAYTEPDAVADPPCVLLGAPRLAWETPGAEPDEATFAASLVVARGSRSLEQLDEHVIAVAAAIERHPSAAVTQATPGTYPAGAGIDLPAYEITIGSVL